MAKTPTKTHKPRTCPNLYAAFDGSAWPLRIEKLEQIRAFLEARNAGVVFNAVEVAQRVGTRNETEYQIVNGVAVIPIEGVISQRVDRMTEISGGTSTERVGAMFDQAMIDPAVKAVVLDVNSPGGSSFGVMELANKIFNAKGKKPITAIADSEMASAAYWIGAAADEIVVTPSGWVGSVGVYYHHADYSESETKAGVKHTFVKAGTYKTDGNQLEPLSETARDDLQKTVNTIYADFLSDLSRFRGKIASRNNFGEGKMFLARDAVESRMADRVGTFEEVLNGLQKSISKQSARTRAMREAEIMSLEI